MILGIIPARGGSALVPDKNVYPICGIPMIEYTIEAAAMSNLDDWFVFTDKYLEYKTYEIKRLTEHSQGEYNSVIKWLPYAISCYEEKFSINVDTICLLQPTSPLRTSNDINKAIVMHKAHSLVTGYNMRIKTDDKVDGKVVGTHFQRNGAIFMFDKYMIEKGKLFDVDSVKMEMPFSRSIEIDDEDDLFVAESLIKRRLT